MGRGVFGLVFVILLVGSALVVPGAPGVPAWRHSEDRADCVVVAPSASPEDIARARSGCERAVDRYTLLFGAAPPEGVLEVSDTVRVFASANEGDGWRMIWPTTDRIRESLAATSGAGADIERAVEEHWSTVLPHELGHLMLIADADRRRPEGIERRRLPDWFHEGITVFMEPTEYRSVEYGTLRAHAPFIPAIDDLLRFRIEAPEGLEGGATITRTFFPCASEEACDGRPYWNRSFSVRTRYYPDGRVVTDTIIHDAPPPPPTPLETQFYAYAATLVQYVHDRGGAAAMSALLDRYVRSEGAMVDLAGLPGLPGTPAAVEADWRRWFEGRIFGGQATSGLDP